MMKVNHIGFVCNALVGVACLCCLQAAGVVVIVATNMAQELMSRTGTIARAPDLC